MKFGFQIKTLSRMIKKKIDGAFAFRENADLTGIQGWVLRFLHDRERSGEEVFQRDIERSFQVRRSTATELLNTMEANGYIRRVPVERDARLKKLELTEKGRRLQEEVIAAINGVEDSLTEGFTEEEKNTLSAVLEKLRRTWESKGW